MRLSDFRVNIVFFILLGFGLLFSTPGLFAQKSKSQIEREKQDNLKKIQEAEKILKETEGAVSSSVGQLNALNAQINARQELIKSINQEVQYLEREIGEIGSVIDAMEADLEMLKEEYAHMVYAAAKSNNVYNRLTFLFSSTTFNQLVLRLQYLKQYADTRKIQVDQIEKVKLALGSQRTSVERKKGEKEELLQSQIDESKNLIALRGKQNQVVKNLQQKESEIKKEVASRKKSLDELDKMLATIVREEMAKSAKAEKSATEKATAADLAKLSSSFSENQNRLFWPVSSGFVSTKFGQHPHPILKGITVNCDGVDIQTNKGEQVRAVFNGRVVKVASVPGMNKAIIVQHGEYFTLYAKMQKVFVKNGDEIKTNQVLGEVYTDKNGISELQFQIWHNQKKLDPEKWLTKR